MADSQSGSNAFSVRIVSIDHYMAPPTHGLDNSYSSFQGGKVNEVPVIRIYGSTPAGQKTCLHVHGIYLFNHTRKIDCNLYGMGHMHLSKMQFCHPVPDTFSPRKSDHISQHMDDDLHAN